MQLRRKLKYRRKKGPLPFRYVFLLSFIIFIILSLQGVWLVHYNIRPTIVEIANLETQKIATSAINYAMKSTMEEIDSTQLIKVEKDANGNITTLGFEANIYNQVVASSVANAQYYLKKLEEGKLHELDPKFNKLKDKNSNIIYEIPLGMVTKNSILANIGPKIPVKLTAIGDVDVDIRDTIKSVGINNTWIDLSLDLHVQAQVIIPFATFTDHVSTTIPVGMVFIPGDVPNFYANGIAEAPKLAIVD